MKTNTPTILTLELDVDGGINLQGGDVNLTIPTQFLIANDLFNEDRENGGISVWDTDSDLCTEIMNGLASAHGWTVDYDALKKAMRLACIPGGPFFDPADFQIRAWKGVRI